LKFHSNVSGELGYAVCEEGVRHGLLVKAEEGFIPMTPSTLLNSDEKDEVKKYAIEEAVEIYSREFAALQAHNRSPGLMAKEFLQLTKPIPNYVFEKC
jgi:hypothetical protein